MWDYLKTHDVPNWIVLFFSLLVWPMILCLWNKRTEPWIRNLLIGVDPAGGVIPTGESCPYLVIEFDNNTGENVYIANAAIRVTNRIEAHRNADKDISTQYYTLKFAEKSGEPFSRLQVTLSTGQRVTTGLPLSNEYLNNDKHTTLFTELKSHKSHKIWAKYFTLRFDTMIGDRYRRVKFKF